MDITLDDVLTILYEHYNNVKALDALNQELFQLLMVDKEIVLDWGVHLLTYLQVLAASFPNCFPLNHVDKLKWDCFYGGLSKGLKAMVAYLKASLHKKDLSQLPLGCKGSRKGRLYGVIPKPIEPGNW